MGELLGMLDLFGFGPPHGPSRCTEYQEEGGSAVPPAFATIGVGRKASIGSILMREYRRSQEIINTVIVHLLML